MKNKLHRFFVDSYENMLRDHSTANENFNIWIDSRPYPKIGHVWIHVKRTVPVEIKELIQICSRPDTIQFKLNKPSAIVVQVVRNVRAPVT